MSEERRRLIKKVLVLPGDATVERKSVRFLELLTGKEVALGREGEEVCFAPDAPSTLQEGVYTWGKV